MKAWKTRILRNIQTVEAHGVRFQTGIMLERKNSLRQRKTSVESLTNTMDNVEWNHG